MHPAVDVKETGDSNQEHNRDDNDGLHGFVHHLPISINDVKCLHVDMFVCDTRVGTISGTLRVRD